MKDAGKTGHFEAPDPFMYLAYDNAFYVAKVFDIYLNDYKNNKTNGTSEQDYWIK